MAEKSIIEDYPQAETYGTTKDNSLADISDFVVKLLGDGHYETDDLIDDYGDNVGEADFVGSQEDGVENGVDVLGDVSFSEGSE